MTSEAIDRRLERLERDAQASREALLEIELDHTREQLEKSALTGVTATAWTTAAAEFASAWEAQTLLDDHLARARRARSAERERLVGAGTHDELRARCSAPLTDMRELLVHVADAWGAYVPRLTTVSATVRACADLLDELGAPPQPDLARAREELAALTDAVAKDPLGAPAERIDALEHDVAVARASVEQLRDFRTDAEHRIAEARALLDEARRAEQDAREAHRTAQEKIAGAQLPSPVAVPDDLAAELDRVADLARSAAWPEACERLYRWHLDATRARDDAQAVAAANRAPIATRDELRGRLNAYQAKAQRLRLLEDPALAALHARAHRMLHTAPTDLDAAADVLRQYQRGLSSNAERETVR
ncbi:MAG TPA: hypothetical protein VKB54_11700 [Solirubrobacteraceae bacterium]|nr:hypothetical protein [Solirubrobacteraceae bacterium]